MWTTTMETPIGGVRLYADSEALVRVWLPGERADAPEAPEDAGHPVLRRVVDALEAWFAGRRTTFDLPLRPEGTAFQLAVWAELARIPYGETRSYRDIADALGRPTAVRAVGAANGRNPLPIVVPCHRVIGADGRLTGFGGGLPAKAWLLEHERRTTWARRDAR